MFVTYKVGKFNDGKNSTVNQSVHSFGTDMAKGKKQNTVLWTYNGDKRKKFDVLELEYYEKMFGESLKKQNKRHEKGRHYSRCKTMDEYYSNKRTSPECVSIQIVDLENTVNTDELWKCLMKYRQQFDSGYGSNCKILTLLLTKDNNIYNVRIRRVWNHYNRYGEMVVGKTGGLEEIGIQRPNLDLENSISNNRTAAFTEIEKNLFENVCKYCNLKMEFDSSLDEKPNISAAQNEYQKLMNNVLKTQENLRRLSDRKESIKREIQEYDTTKAIEKMTEIEKKYEDIKIFLESKGLIDEYEQYLIQKKGTSKEISRMQRVRNKYVSIV